MRKEVADGHNSTIKMVCQQIAIHMHIRAEETNARFEPLWFVWSLVAAILVAAAAACMHVCVRLCVSVCSLSFRRFVAAGRHSFTLLATVLCVENICADYFLSVWVFSVLLLHFAGVRARCWLLLAIDLQRERKVKLNNIPDAQNQNPAFKKEN